VRLDSREILAAVVTLHSVETRHAAWIRHIIGIRPARNAFDRAAPQSEMAKLIRSTRFIVSPPKTSNRRRPPSRGEAVRGRNRAALLLLLAFALAAAVGVAWSQRGSGGGSDALSDAANLPPPPRPAFRPPPATPLADRSTSVWAPVRKSALARAAPSFGSRTIAPVGTETAEGTTNLVLVIARRRVDGRSWVKVRLSVLPNNTTGWVPRATLGGYHFVDTHLVVELDRLTASLYKHGRVVFRTPVGVGTSSAPTPAGEFYVRDKLTS
jgi:hypothetical protein